MSLRDEDLIHMVRSPKARLEALERLARSLGVAIPSAGVHLHARRRMLVQRIEAELHRQRLSRRQQPARPHRGATP